jgi:hypothetical protein
MFPKICVSHAASQVQDSMGSGQLHTSAALPAGKEPPLPNEWIGSWMGPRTGLDYEGRIEILPLPGLELQPLDHSAHSDCAILAPKQVPT